MSEVNELYFENFVRDNNLDLLEIYNDGDNRLSEKIEILKANPDIKFADFGTRRRFSLRWQKHVVGRLINECPGNFIGTSNVGLARAFDVWPIGTFAHEMPMVYAGLADQAGKSIRDSHGEFLDDWSDRYGENLSTALTDTYTTNFFFKDFTPERAQKWRSLRHDSGDPFEFGEKVIAFYEVNGINPLDKTIVFSDGLDIDEIVSLHKYFKDKINVVFGWGTTLTNDLGIPALNIVMKAIRVNGVDTVKVSDNKGKELGPINKLERYHDEFEV
jgi:nicotinate phosphoribosyltransferase